MHENKPTNSHKYAHINNQSRNDLFSNTYNSDWSNHSNSIWWEPQQAQHEGYWQLYEEFYSKPMHPPQPPPQQFQPNSGSSIDCDQILEILTTLTQEVQNQDKKLGELKNQNGRDRTIHGTNSRTK